MRESTVNLRNSLSKAAIGAARIAALPALAAATGAIAWIGAPGAIALALVMPALWVAGRNRWHGAATVCAYQLAATRDAPVSFAHYYGSFVGIGAVLWLAGALVTAVPWLLTWHRARDTRRIILFLPLILSAVPPIGIAGWVHPLSAAGVIFPATAWFGLIAACALIFVMATLRPFRLLIAAGALLAIGIAGDVSPPSPPGWIGIDTFEAFGRGDVDMAADYSRQLRLIRLVAQQHTPIVVLPESAGGFWTKANAGLWADKIGFDRRGVILVGAHTPNHDSSTTNGLIALSKGSADLVYRQRMPVPISMWHPWRPGGTRAYWFANPVVSIAGKRAAVFVCYEQLIPWTVLESMLYHPDVFVCCSNDWWCSGSTIPNIQLNGMRSWARLFNEPLVSATNY